MTQFAFLEREWPAVLDSAHRAESAVHADPRTACDLPGFAGGMDHAKFQAKLRSFLRAHQDHIAIHKLRTNKPLTATDLSELERMLVDAGIGAEDLHRAAHESHGLGLFVRSLIGMDRGAAKEALSDFIARKALNANQIEFVDLIVNQLTEHGAMEASALYESPFTDGSPRGPDDLFSGIEIDALIAALDRVRQAATAA